MNTFAFRLNCKLADCHIETVAREVDMNLSGLGLTISMNFPETNSEGAGLVAWCGGFDSESDARDTGVRFKQAIMLAGVLIGIGIDVGTDKVVSHAMNQADGQPDDRLQPNVHGLQIVPDLENMLFGDIVFGRPATRVSPNQLVDRINEADRLNRLINKKQWLAAQLYNESHFHTAEPAQFLTLVSAVEVLAIREKRDMSSLKLIDKLIELLSSNDELESANKESLKHGLYNLKFESIGAACRRLIKSFVGKDEASRFKAMYEVRSKMIHEGEPPPGTDLAKEIRELDFIVRRLIAKHVSSSQTQEVSM